MGRVIMNTYGYSKSGKELRNYLGIKRIRFHGSRFVAKNSDVIINWGNPKGEYRIKSGHTPRILNKKENIMKAVNKITTLTELHEAGVSVPEFHTSASELQEGTYMARTIVSGHSGRGIELFTLDEENTTIPHAPLYTKYINKSAEYRAMVAGNRVVDFKQKKRKRDYEGDREEGVWNHSNGYVFARQDVVKPDGLDELSVNAVEALGLDFGAVDIIADEDGTLYVLEINTAFGIEGSTLELVGDALKELIEG